MPDGMTHSSRAASQHARVRRALIAEDNLEWDDVPALCTSGLVYVSQVPTPPVEVDHVGCVEEKMTYSFDFFEKFHVSPPSFILGNVLATINTNVTVYSAYRTDVHSWDSFVNNAGSGTSLLNIPSLPAFFSPQTGLTNLILEVTPNGPPKVDSTLDFVFDTMTISPIIQLDRLVLWAVQPNLPYTELLQFATKILPRIIGSEQRIGLRGNPRQIFEWNMLLEPGPERARIHNLLFEWQSRVFGVPMWHEATFPSVEVSVSDTSVTVRSTAYADYREGGLVLLFDPVTEVNDVVEIAAGGITGTVLTFTNPVLNAYSLRATVCPLRTGKARPSLKGSRFSTDAAKLSIRFQILDNVANLADISAWNTHADGRVIVDDCNVIGSSMSEEFLREIVQIENIQGRVGFETPWEKGKRRSTKTFSARTPAALWKVRQLLHALRGRQVAFYLPTFGQDFVPFSQLISGSTTLTVINVGFDRYVNQRRPYSWIKVHFVDPVTNPPLIREITGSSEVDSDSENLTLDATWPATYQVSDVKRIEFLELVRFDSDTIQIKYAEGAKTVRISFPVVTVFD